MARRPTIRQQIATALDRYEPELQKAFEEAIAIISNDARLNLVAERLERGDVDGAIDAIGLDRAAFAQFEDALGRAYVTGGNIGASGFTAARISDPSGANIILRFDARALRAEAVLREHSATLVTRILDDQRVMLRNVMTDALSVGRGPMATALDIAGRVAPGTNRRVGGLIGLTSHQEGYVRRATEDLLSGDPERMKHYLELTRRDRRFDRTVLRAMANETPLDRSTVTRITGRLSDSYLQLRAETIARTETLAAVNAGNHEAFRQGLSKTNYTEADVTRTWDTAGDSKVRHSHAAMDGQQVRGLDAPFVTPSGARMMYPGDASLGAGAGETINCRCRERIRVDPFGGRA